MSAHTPGPWRRSKHNPRAVFGPKSAAALAHTHARDPEMTDEEVEANTRLVAAAPELLAALKQLSAELGSWRNAPEVAVETFRKARAAIAQAEGQS